MHTTLCQRGSAVVRVIALIAMAGTLMLLLFPTAPRDHQDTLPAMPLFTTLSIPH